MRFYKGVIVRATRMAQVSVYEGEVRVGTLAPRFDLMNHSPTGFSWGYGGSGPSQLALAILADHFGRHGSNRALDLYQDFKWKCIAILPGDEGFTLSGEHVQNFVNEIEAERRRLGGET